MLTFSLFADVCSGSEALSETLASPRATPRTGCGARWRWMGRATMSWAKADSATATAPLESMGGGAKR